MQTDALRELPDMLFQIVFNSAHFFAIVGVGNAVVSLESKIFLKRGMLFVLL